MKNKYLKRSNHSNYLYEEFFQRIHQKSLFCFSSYQSHQIKFQRIHNYCKTHGFILDHCTVNMIQKSFASILTSAFDDDIEGNENRNDIKLQLTHVNALPSRSEQGIFLIIELGNLVEDIRFSLVLLLGKQIPSYQILHSRGYNLSEEIRQSNGSILLDHLALDLKEFLKQVNQEVYRNHPHTKHSFQISADSNLPHSLPLGLLLHFPIKQKELNHAEILSWSGRFNCPDLLEHDIILLLQQSIERTLSDHQIHIIACLQENVAALISVAFEYPNTFLSLIFKDQFQLAFVEDIEILRSKNLFQENQLRALYRTILSLNFQDLHSKKSIKSHALFQTLLTSIDTSVMHQLNVNYFDLFTCDFCILEIIRLLIIELCIDEQLVIECKLHLPGAFGLKFVSYLLQGKYSQLKPYFNEIGLKEMKKLDFILMEYICHVILRRSTQILSCLIVCFAHRYNQENLTIAIDSYLYRSCTIYQIYMHKEIEYLCKQWITMFHLVNATNKSYVIF